MAFNINVLVTDNGNGSYTPTILRNPTTAASGGTSVTVTSQVASPITGVMGTAFNSPMQAIQAALVAVGNNRSDNPNL